MRKTDPRVVESRNARTLDYRDQLRAIQEAGLCPFCEGGETFKSQPMAYENDHWWVTKNRAPLKGARLHLVFFPKRHLLTWLDLTSEEFIAWQQALSWAHQEFKIEGGVNLYGYGREGEPIQTGATVLHFHTHYIVPEGLVQVSFGPYPQNLSALP